MSALRARCPACRVLTAVALGPGYECHVCGRTYAAALVVVEPAPVPEVPLPLADVVAAVEELPRRLPARPVVVAGEAAHALLLEALAAAHGDIRWRDAGDVRVYIRGDGRTVGALAAPGVSPAGLCSALEVL